MLCGEGDGDSKSGFLGAFIYTYAMFTACGGLCGGRGLLLLRRLPVRTDHLRRWLLRRLHQRGTFALSVLHFLLACWRLSDTGTVRKQGLGKCSVSPTLPLSSTDFPKQIDAGRDSDEDLRRSMSIG